MSAIALKSALVLLAALATVSMAVLLVAAALAVGTPWNPSVESAAANASASSSTSGGIVFTSSRDGNHEIYVMNADGSGQTRLTNNLVVDRQPAWSPDGSRIAFSSEDNSIPGITVMSDDGSGQTRLNGSGHGFLTSGFSPSWSPDGNRIAFGRTFLVTGTPPPPIILVMNADGSGETGVSEGEHPAWSPDGSRIAFDRNGDIHVVKVDGTGDVQLTDNGQSELPRWSPDGSRIAFLRADNSSGGIYVMSADGSGSTFVTESSFDRVPDLGPAWSPDGQRLAFADSSSGNVDIYTVNLDGSDRSRVTTDPANDFDPDWFADSVQQPTPSAVRTNPPTQPVVALAATSTPAPTSVATSPTATPVSRVLATPTVTPLPASGGAAPLSNSAPDPIVGDWNVTYGAPAAVTISGSSAAYTLKAKSPVRVTGGSCDLAPGTVIATFSWIGGNSYSGQHGLWNTTDCSFGSWTSVSLTLNGDTLSGRLGNSESHTFTRSTHPPAVSRPDIVKAVPDPTQISTDPGVVGTNLVLATIAVVVILLSAEVFNETIGENRKDIESFARRYVRPLGSPVRAAASAWRRVAAINPRPSGIASIGTVLGATALVYGFLEPAFKFNEDGVVLLISVVGALGALTYASSGIEGRFVKRQFGLTSSVRVYPVALTIAIASVLLSRIVSFEPGIVYGFVASTVVAGELKTPQRGKVTAGTHALLLVAFFVAWGAMIPARAWADHNANVLSVVLEATLTLFVVSSIEGVALSMVPAKFMNGKKVLDWNRIAWLALALPAAFLFVHVLLAQDSAGLAAMGKHGTIGVLAALGVCVGLTASAWGFLAYRRGRRPRVESQQRTEPSAPQSAQTPAGGPD